VIHQTKEHQDLVRLSINLQ